MSRSRRIFRATFLATLGFIEVLAANPVPLSADLSSAGISAPVTVVGASESDHAAIGWAVDRFQRGGLELPPVVIEIHTVPADCDGYDGLFRSSETPPTVLVCNRSRYIVLHELAHAWEHHNLTDDTRQEFMELLGLTAWSDHDVAWKERGVEVVAEIITWGLYDNDLTADLDEKLMKQRAYSLITGALPGRHRGATDVGAETRSRAVEDPGNADPSWDELR
jgi:hypothetical protein